MMMEPSLMAKKVSIKAGAKKPESADIYRRVRGKTPDDWTSATFFLPRNVHRDLRIAALDRGTTLQAILAQATDEWLRKRGLPPWPVEEAT